LNYSLIDFIVVYQAAFMETHGLKLKQQLKWLWHRFAAYEIFGFLACLLLFIPLLSSVFYFTNLCGAALWAIEMAKSNAEFKRLILAHSSPGEEAPVEKSEIEPDEETGLLE
jgi:hypothetical protein